MNIHREKGLALIDKMPSGNIHCGEVCQGEKGRERERMWVRKKEREGEFSLSQTFLSAL